MAKKPRIGICTYCGNESEVTEDHVIPQCLWDGPVPKNVPKVPACTQCNHILKSELDTYLRDLLITDKNSADSPVVQGLRPKYIRSVLRNQSRMDRDYREKGEVIAKMSQSGLYQFGLISQTVNQRTEQIMSMIVRGLHRYYLHTLLSKDTSFTITRLFKQEQCEELRSIIETLHGGYDIIGNGDVFACGFASPSRQYSLPQFLGTKFLSPNCLFCRD